MPSFLGRMSAAESKRVFDAEGTNGADGLFVTRMISDYSGFEIDYIEKSAFKTIPVSMNNKGFTSGGPTFETLPQFLQYYHTIYKRQYNRSYPRLSCFRWDLGLKETHALLKSASVNQFILRLSTSQANCLSMGYKQADGKPCQILITLGPGGTYIVGNNTFTDFNSLLAAPSFYNLIPLPSPTRALGAVQIALTEYFDRETTAPHYTQLRRGTSVAALEAPTTDPSLYLMTTQHSTDYPAVEVPVEAPTTSSRSAFPVRATSGTLSSFPSRAKSPTVPQNATAAPSADVNPSSAYGDMPSTLGKVAAGSPKDAYNSFPSSRQASEQAIIDSLLSITSEDRDHLLALRSPSQKVQNFLDKVRAYFLSQEQAIRNRQVDI